MLADDNLLRPPAIGASDLEFAGAERHFGASHQEGERIAADDDADRHRLVERLIFVAMNASVLAGRDVEAEPLGVMDHDAIGAGVDPAVLRITRDVEAAGADIAVTLVAVVPDRRGEARDVNRYALDHVLHDRPGLHDLIGQRLVGDLLEIGEEGFR